VAQGGATFTQDLWPWSSKAEFNPNVASLRFLQGLKNMSCVHMFDISALCVLYGFRSPILAPRGSQDSRLRPQDGLTMTPRWPQNGPKLTQDGPKLPSDGFKRNQQSIKNRSCRPRWFQRPAEAPRRPHVRALGNQKKHKKVVTSTPVRSKID
jgi:hypothetical protein